MKKNIVFLLSILLLFSLVGCQLKEDAPPAGTTANTTAAITTAAPEATPSASSLEFEKLPKPYSGSTEHAAWLESLDLPETLPTDTLEYDYLCGYGDPALEFPGLAFGKTLMISTPEELEFFYEHNPPPNRIGGIFPSDVREILDEVDLTKQSILIVSGDWSQIIDMSLKTIAKHGDDLIVLLESQLADDQMASDALMYYSFVVAIDKEDLPDGAETEIYVCTEFPHHSLYGEYPERVAYPDNRYVFVPTDEEE